MPTGGPLGPPVPGRIWTALDRISKSACRGDRSLLEIQRQLDFIGRDVTIVDSLAKFIFNLIEGSKRGRKEIRLIFVRSAAEPFRNIAPGRSSCVSQLVPQIEITIEDGLRCDFLDLSLKIASSLPANQF